MKITFLEADQEIDILSLLKQKSIHYVSIAMPGLTIASAAIQIVGGFDFRHRNDFMMQVNHAKETGTLYPQVNLTLLPSPTASYGGLDSTIYHPDGDYPPDLVFSHILDAFKANTEYIKSSRMYFDFRKLSVSESYYLSCLQTAIKQLDSHSEQFLEEIITWKAN
jgi:hypothetical protein